MATIMIQFFVCPRNLATSCHCIPIYHFLKHVFQFQLGWVKVCLLKMTTPFGLKIIVKYVPNFIKFVINLKINIKFVTEYSSRKLSLCYYSNLGFSFIEYNYCHIADLTVACLNSPCILVTCISKFVLYVYVNLDSFLLIQPNLRFYLILSYNVLQT